MLEIAGGIILAYVLVGVGGGILATLGFFIHVAHESRKIKKHNEAVKLARRA